MHGRRSVALLVGVLAIVVGGCVSLSPQQKDALADVQQFAAATAAAYGLMRIPVTVEAATNLGIGGRYRQGNFYLNANTLTSGHLDVLVAHELAHYVLGHEPVSGNTMAEMLKAQEAKELDANAKAVEILTRFRGMSQAQAVRRIVVFLRSAQNAQMRGNPNAPGHLPPAEEIADLLKRFPEVSATAVSALPAPLAAPAWKPGDQWTFWWENPRGSGTFVWAVDREQVVDGTEYYVIRSRQTRDSDPTREFFYQKADLAWRMVMVNGALESKSDPAQMRYMWPLTVGGEWEQTVAITTESQGKSSKETRGRACQVTGEETVTVAGGTYRTIKTECRDTATKEVVFQIWYSPEAKHWVKEWSRLADGGVQERELMAVRFK